MSTENKDNIKAQLAAGAAKIREAQAASKKPAAKKAKKNVSAATPASKSPKAKKSKASKSPKEKRGQLEVIPAIKEASGPIEKIIEKRVTMDKSNVGMTLDPNTSAGEAVRLFDFFCEDTELAGIRLGNFLNEAAKLKCFAGKYAAAMASTGRSLDRLKTFASVAKNVPPSLCNKHHEIKFEHLRAIAKVPELEDKKKLVDEMVKAADAGKPLTVKEVKAKANKLAPRSPRPKKKKGATEQTPATRWATAEEKQIIERMEEVASDLESRLSAASFLNEIEESETAILRGKLTAIKKVLDEIS